MHSLNKNFYIREKFKRGEHLNHGEVRLEILESWQRCRSYGLEFSFSKHWDFVTEDLQQRIEKRKTVFDIANDFMKQIYALSVDSGFVFSFSDEEGYVLSVVGEEYLIKDIEKDKGFRVGCSRNEKTIGTNAIGTSIYLKRPVTVRAWEHYFYLDQRWMCCGAPIFDSEHNVVGVFCLTGLDENVSSHTFGMVAATAAAISRQLSTQEVNIRREIEQNRMKIILENLASGIMLADNFLNVFHMNKTAMQLLERPEEDIIGNNIGEIFDYEFFTIEYLKRGIEEKRTTSTYDAKKLNFSVSIRPTPTKEYIITFEKIEKVHKKIRRIIGSEAYFSFEDIVGNSSSINNTITLAKVASSNNAMVLLTGESGTGKELFAQAIHNASDRKKGPFVAINCGALPKSLVESELFGYEGGAFTGARREGHTGKFELAEGGTLFLDEIGEMPFEVQTMLLRVLQNKRVSRVGSNQEIDVDVRIISATNKNLLAAVEEGAFRHDLYYRLNVFNIYIPPLRERTKDIRQLALYFLKKYSKNAMKNVSGFSENAYRALELHDWPGNVRELENTVERAVYLTDTGVIDVKQLNIHSADTFAGSEFQAASTRSVLHFDANAFCHPGDDRLGLPAAPSLPQRISKEDIEHALAATGGNVRKASGLLGVSRCTMYRKMLQCGIDNEKIRRMA